MVIGINKNNMVHICPKCNSTNHNGGICYCGHRFRSCLFHKWRIDPKDEFRRICIKCGRLQRRGMSFGWSDDMAF